MRSWRAQDALKGFPAANGVLWFHQEAGPGVSAESMVGGRDAFFLGPGEWLMGGCFIYLNACNVRIFFRYRIMNISSGPDQVT